MLFNALQNNLFFFFFFSKMFTDLTIITFVRFQHKNDSVKCTARNFELLAKQSLFKTDSYDLYNQTRSSEKALALSI